MPVVEQLGNATKCSEGILFGVYLDELSNQLGQEKYRVHCGQ